MTAWDPVGIDTTAAFREYVERLREAWPEQEDRLEGGGDSNLSDTTA